jgi:hypothetical protein
MPLLSTSGYTHPADPRHLSLLRRYKEQDQLRDQALIAILLPPEKPDEVDFRTQFESQYGRQPQPEDIPRCPDIPYILPDTTPISDQDITEYHQTIRTVILSQPIPPPPSGDYPPPPPTPTATSSAKTPPQSTGTFEKGLAGAHFGEKDQIALKNKAVE